MSRVRPTCDAPGFLGWGDKLINRKVRQAVLNSCPAQYLQVAPLLSHFQHRTQLRGTNLDASGPQRMVLGVTAQNFVSP